MMSNFWRHCAISVLKISKTVLQHLIFFVKINFLLDVVHINTTILIWLLSGKRKAICLPITVMTCPKSW